MSFQKLGNDHGINQLSSKCFYYKVVFMIKKNWHRRGIIFLIPDLYLIDIPLMLLSI